MDEAQIKAAILTHLRSTVRRGKKPTVTSEFSLGSASVRADLAILADEFIGIEIKSAADSLKRLPAQMSGYAMHFDRVILVAAERHLKRVSEADLCGAALWSITANGVIQTLHAGEANNIAPAAYMNLLTQAEIERLIYRPMARMPMAPGLADRQIRLAFEEAFEKRYTASSDAFWRAVARKRIQADDLSLLSRFAEERLRRKALAEKQADFWQGWADSLRSEYALTA
ncbi:sce7726 family protein [Sphingobium sp. EM0848]|uniref:sce7726 family protein n=1 Tax=Sphingobium sp. EM0848 TaxID=2743473 RepID=UPI00159C3EE2|nr:sce7726 family protein [Sphingobium sp. EM0848]